MGALASAAIARMDEVLPWYRAMPAENRSWVNLVAQAGVAAFVEWFRAARGPAGHQRRRVRHRPARADPVGDPAADRRAGPGRHRRRRGADRADRPRRRGRRCARPCCATRARSPSRPPRCTPQAAEARGAWDARLESLVVDALLRGEADDSLRSRAAALGWGSHDSVVVVVGNTPDAEPEAVVDEIRRAARAAHLDVLTGVQGDRLVAILGGHVDPVHADPHCWWPSSGPVRWSSARPSRTCSPPARARRRAWPGCSPPRPGRTRRARSWPTTCCRNGRSPATSWRAQRLVQEIYRPLQSTGTALVETLAAFLEQTSSLEATARLLFVHPNTVRYRLRRVTEVSGYARRGPAGRPWRCGSH